MMYGGLARETGHVHRPHLSNRNITPEELDGLEAVLKLTERVADQVGHKLNIVNRPALIEWLVEPKPMKAIIACTIVNHNKRKQQNEPMRTQSKYTSHNCCQAQENVCDQLSSNWFWFSI